MKLLVPFGAGGFYFFSNDDINLLVAEITLALFEITSNLFEITLLAFEITPLIRVLSFIAFCGAKSHGFGQLGFKVLGELLLNGCEFPYYVDELLAKLDEFPSNHCEFPPASSGKIKTPSHYAKTFHHFGFGMS